MNTEPNRLMRGLLFALPIAAALWLALGSLAKLALRLLARAIY